MWKSEKLGDAIEIARGGSPRPIKSFITTEGDGVNWIKIGDTEQGGKYINTTKEKIKPSGVSGSRYVKEGDFLLSNSMSFGRPYILKTSGCIHDGWLVLSDYQELFSADYLYYLLSSPLVQNQFKRLARGSTVRNLNIELVSQVTVLVPPLAEQQRIVAKLDAAFAEIDTAIEVAEANAHNAGRIFDNHLSNIFCSSNPNWENNQLKNIASKIGSGATPKGGQAAYKEEGVSLIRSMNVHDMRFKYKNLAKIDEGQASKLSNVALQENDILLNITGASVARCCVVESNVLPGRVNQHVAIIRAKEETVIPKLLAYGLTSKPYKDKLLAVGDSGGSTRQAITKKQIEDFVMSYPKGQQEQQKLTKRLDSILLQSKELSEIYEKKIGQYAALKAAILTQELTPPAESEAA